VIISYTRENEAAVAAACQSAGVPFASIGTVGGDRLVIAGLVDQAVSRLSEAWRTAIPALTKRASHV